MLGSRNKRSVELVFLTMVWGACRGDFRAGEQPGSLDLGGVSIPWILGAPKLDSLTPARGPNNGGLALTLSGQNFAVGATVTVGGELATEVTVWSGTLLTAKLPPKPGFFGNVPVVVQNPDGQQATRSDGFLYYASRLPFSKALFDAGPRILAALGDFNGDQKLDLIADGPSSIRLLLNNGAGGFGAATVFGISGQPSAAVVGDWNGDRKLDLAVTSAAAGNVSVLLGDGMGGFAAATSFAAGSGPTAIAVGDFNGDSTPDLAVANPTSNKVSVLLGDGMGGFGAASTFTVGTLPSAIAIGDFNGDNKPDLAVANQTSNTISVLPGDGLGGFGAATSTSAGSPSSIVVGDFNLDRNLDLVYVGGGSARVGGVLLGDGLGGFRAGSNFAIDTGTSRVTSRDLNGDQKLDLAIASTSGVRLLLGDGRGGFRAPAGLPNLLTAASQLEIGDLNGDRQPDLVCATAFGIVMWLGDGLGGLVDSTVLGGSTTRGVVGDFNADQKLDLATVGQNVAVTLGDGMGGLASVTTRFLSYTAPELAVGDFDGDTRLDLAIASADGMNVLLGNGQGGFGTILSLRAPLSLYSYTMAVGDFDGDQISDVAIAPLGGFTGPPTITLFLSHGKGDLSTIATVLTGPPGTYLRDYYASLAAGDFNGDAILDLAVGQGTGVVILLGGGTGEFSTGSTVGLSPRSMVVGDFNGDQKLDLASPALPSSVGIALGDGLGAFAVPTTFVAGTSAASLLAGDFNGDKKLDLAVFSTSSMTTQSVMNVFMGNGLGSFGSSSSFLAAGPALAGDYNRDQKTDLIFFNYSANLRLSTPYLATSQAE